VNAGSRTRPASPTRALSCPRAERGSAAAVLRAGAPVWKQVLVSEVVSEDLGFVGPPGFRVVWTVASSVDLTDWGHLLRAWTTSPSAPLRRSPSPTATGGLRVGWSGSRPRP